MRALGPILSGIGSSDADLGATENSVRAAFYANTSFFLNKAIPMGKRMARLDSVAGGIIRVKACAWTPEKVTYERLNKLQNELLAAMLLLRPLPTDTPKAFCTRRNQTVGRLPKTPWAHLAATAAAAWYAHMLRHPEEPAAAAFRTLDTNWLEDQRTAFSQLSLAGLTSRTKTRAHRGKVIRWNNKNWVTATSASASSNKNDHKKTGEALLKLLKVPTHSLTDFL